MEVLWILELDIDTDVFRQPAGEQLSLLRAASVRHTRLERLLVRLDGDREWQRGQVRPVVRAKRRPDALVAQALEFLPLRSVGVPFKDIVPLLGEPNFLHLGGALGLKELSHRLS